MTLASTSTATTVRGIAEFDAVPTAAQVASLEGLGLVVQPMRRVPLALVLGPLTAMQAAVAGDTARDIYPDDPIQLLDPSSSDAMGAGSLRAAGLTGKGVTVAVVDSGCDASHPDLADHVAHNVKLYSPDTVTLRDAAGQLLGTTTESLTEGAGTASVLIDLRSFATPPVAYGAFSFEVSGAYAASDPDTLDSDSLLGRMVTLQVAQVIAGR